MYSGDVPSTSGHHSHQPSFYSHPPANHHAQGPLSSRDGPPEDSRDSASPQYAEMMPVRLSNEDEEMEGHGEFLTGGEGTGDMRAAGGGTKNGEGGGPSKKIPVAHKKIFKVDGYNMKKMIRDFWPMQRNRVENMTVKHLREASRNQVLPLARVKKIMKIDDNVQKQMIAADAPLLLSVASEMFIEELTLRSWEVTEEAKRKTLQKTDVATASTRHDHMDFLIDIIPRTGIIPRPKEMMAKTQDRGHAQMVQIVRDGASVSQLMKGASSLLSEGGHSSNQQEFSARLESGEEAQVIQIGKPIPLSSQAMSQLGLGPPPSTPSHHSSHQQPPPSSHSTHSHPSTSSHPQTTLRIPSNIMGPPAHRGKGMTSRGGRGGQGRQHQPSPLSQGGLSRSKN